MSVLDATLWARDYRRLERASPHSASAYLRAAAKRSGRSPISLALEAIRLSRAPGRLSLAEYVQFGLDDSALDEAARLRFVSERLLDPIVSVCNDLRWWAPAWDRWLAERLFASLDVPVASTVAVVARGARSYPGVRVLRTPAELRRVLPEHLAQSGPIFGKEIWSQRGCGAFLLAQADPEGVVLEAEGAFTYERFLDEVLGPLDYVLQPVVPNHAFLDQYTTHLATIRLCVLVADDVARIPFAVLKIPGPGSVTDHFWREGNVACELDPATGVIIRARTVDVFGTCEHVEHPALGIDLVGETVPLWSDVLALARRSAEILAPLRYQALDVALTPQGPLLVESNVRGSISFLQLATGRGFLTDEVQDFLRSCGVDVARPPRLSPTYLQFVAPRL